MALSAIFVVTLATIGLLLHRLSKVGRRPKDYPPGPPTLPIIGNLHQMPTEKGHLQFQKWAEEYGPVYSLILGTNVMIVLSSDKAIKDLLDRRSGIYSSRPEMYLGQVISGGFRVLLMVSVSKAPAMTRHSTSLLSSTPGIRRDMAYDPQARAQQPKYQSRPYICPLPRPRKQGHASWFPRPAQPICRPHPEIYELVDHPDGLRVPYHQYRGS
jgi:hypothetical protein